MESLKKPKVIEGDEGEAEGDEGEFNVDVCKDIHQHGLARKALEKSNAESKMPLTMYDDAEVVHAAADAELDQEEMPEAVADVDVLPKADAEVEVM